MCSNMLLQSWTRIYIVIWKKIHWFLTTVNNNYLFHTEDYNFPILQWCDYNFHQSQWNTMALHDQPRYTCCRRFLYTQMEMRIPDSAVSHRLSNTILNIKSKENIFKWLRMLIRKKRNGNQSLDLLHLLTIITCFAVRITISPFSIDMIIICIGFSWAPWNFIINKGTLFVDVSFIHKWKGAFLVRAFSTVCQAPFCAF